MYVLRTFTSNASCIYKIIMNSMRWLHRLTLVYYRPRVMYLSNTVKLAVILASGSNASTVWATTHKAKSRLPAAKQSKGKNYILNLCCFPSSCPDLTL